MMPKNNVKLALQKVLALSGYTIVRKETFDALMEREIASASQATPGSPPDEVRPTYPAASWDMARYFRVDAEQPQALLADHDTHPTHFSEDHYEAGLAARRAGNDELAYACFARAIALSRHEPALSQLREMAMGHLEFARMADAAADPLAVRDALVRVLETLPRHGEAAERLRVLLQPYKEPDLTRNCFIFHDAERADALHREAYKRAIEYISMGGVSGDILEFGVLGGWSSRIFCEILRDIGNFGRIHLFDSFDGLPDYTSDVDLNSWEIGGRKIWADKMRFPNEFLTQFHSAHHLHIRSRLSEIIRRERIFVHKGFYSETLKHDLPLKAAIVHIDCDLYQSTVEVFDALHRMDALQDGCVILFDDWNCNRASPEQGERLAFAQFVEQKPGYSTTPWFSYGYNGMAFLLHRKSA